MDEKLQRMINNAEKEDIDLALNYGTPVNNLASSAIASENNAHLELKGLPIIVDIANINLMPNDQYALARKDGFGASDSSILLGVNPFQTLDELIQSKVRKSLTADELAISEKTSVKMGNDLEPLIIKKFTQYIQPICIKPVDMYKMTEYPFLKINFDGVTQINGIYKPAEIKVVTAGGQKHYIFAKAYFDEAEGFREIPENVSDRNWSILDKAAFYGIPPYYYTQVQAQMMGLAADFGFLSILAVKDWKFYSFFIWQDKAVQNQLIINGYQAWNKVLQLRSGS